MTTEVQKNYHATGVPLLIPNKTATSECLLERSSDLVKGVDKMINNEEALQIRLDKHPRLLPVADFWSDAHIVSLGREIRVQTGRIDNLYLTKYGKLVLVETKLYRNSQARREVVAQSIDYAVSLSKMTFESFELVLKNSKDSHLNKQRGLQDFYEKSFGFEKDHKMSLDFHNRLSASLRDGDFLILIVGDGIHGSAADLTEVLARHPTLRYQLGIVRLSEYAGEGHQLLVPSVVMKTEVVTRSIIKLVRTKEGLNFHTQTPEEERRELFESFLNTISGLTDSGRQFAQDLFEEVEADESLHNAFTAQYWYVKYGSVILFVNTNSRGGSISINDQIKNIKKKHPEVAQWYTQKLIELSPENIRYYAPKRPNSKEKLGIQEHITYDLLRTRFDQFMDVLRELITKLPLPEGASVEPTDDEADLDHE